MILPCRPFRRSTLIGSFLDPVDVWRRILPVDFFELPLLVNVCSEVARVLLINPIRGFLIHLKHRVILII